jgi:hypothetical protein
MWHLEEDVTGEMRKVRVLNGNHNGSNTEGKETADNASEGGTGGDLKAKRDCKEQVSGIVG